MLCVEGSCLQYYIFLGLCKEFFIYLGFTQDYASKNEQDAYLSTMITLHDVERRRSRKDDQHDADFHVHSYKYTLKLSRDECIQSVQICYKAFMAIFGITITRLKTIKKALSITG